MLKRTFSLLLDLVVLSFIGSFISSCVGAVVSIGNALIFSSIYPLLYPRMDSEIVEIFADVVRKGSYILCIAAGAMAGAIYFWNSTFRRNHK
jgi:hypothetical protein